MSSYDITNIQQADGGAGNGVQTNVIFTIGSQSVLTNGDTVTFGMSSESFQGDSFQLSNSQSLTVGSVTEAGPDDTTFTLASGGTVFAANSNGAGEFLGYVGGGYSSGDFTITTGGGGGGGGGKSTVKGAGKITVKGTGKLTIK